MDELTTIVNMVFSALNDHNKALGGALLPTGKSLVFSLGAMIVGWTMIREMITGQGVSSWIVSVIELVFAIGIPLAFVMNYDYFFAQSLVGGFDFIASKLAGSSGDKVEAGVVLGVKAVINVANEMWKASPSLAGAGFTETVTQLPAWLVANIFRLAAVFLMMMVGVVFAGMMLLSQMLVGIALIIGPVMIPWLVVDATGFVFWGWVKFLIVACLYKLTGLLILGYTSSLIPALKKAAELVNLAGPGTVDIAGTAMLLLVAVVMLFLSLQIPSIANALLSGNLSTNIKLPRPQKPEGKGDKPKGE